MQKWVFIKSDFINNHHKKGKILNRILPFFSFKNHQTILYS